MVTRITGVDAKVSIILFSIPNERHEVVKIATKALLCLILPYVLKLNSMMTCKRRVAR